MDKTANVAIPSEVWTCQIVQYGNDNSVTFMIARFMSITVYVGTDENFRRWNMQVTKAVYLNQH